MDLIDLLLSILRFNRSSIYRELVVLASISQNIRRPNKKKSFKRNFRKIYLYASLFKRILSIYSLKNLLIKLFYKENKKINNDLLIIYPNGDEWILRGLSKDLSKELLNQNLNVNYIPFKKLKDNLNYRNFLIIGDDLAKNILRDFPFIINKSSIYITHIRTISRYEVEQMSRFKYIFCQSSLDQMRLSSLGFLPGRVFNLPVGFDQKLFFKTKNVLEREYDFLISTPYKIDYLGSHYWLRKGTPLLVETIKELASKGFKVMLLGDNWNSYNFTNANIKIHSPTYEEKSFYINQCKCYINISLLEGGPVTLLESLACGCFCITKNCGLAHQLSEDFKENCKLIKNYNNKITLTNEIIKNYSSYLEKSFSKSSDYLKLMDYTYENLSIKLKNIIFN